jgi:hypothetical protein
MSEEKGISCADPDHHAGAGIIGSHSPSGIWNRFTSLTNCLPEPLRRLRTLRIAPLLIGHKVLALQSS